MGVHFSGSGGRTGVGPSRREFLAAAGTAAAGVALFDSLAGEASADESSAHRATCMAIDGNYVYTSDDDGKLIRYDLTKILIGVVDAKTYKTKHSKKASYVAAHDTLVLTAGYDGVVKIYNRDMPDDESGVREFTHIGDGRNPEVWAVTISKNGTRVLSSTNDGRIVLWKPTDPPTVLATFAEYAGDKVKGGPVGGIAFVPPSDTHEETRFLSTHGEGEINLWEITGDNIVKKPSKKFTHGNSRAVNSVAVTTNGKFVTVGFDRTVRLWNVNDNKSGKVLGRHDTWVWRVAVAPDDNNFAYSVDDSGLVLKWDLNADERQTPKRFQYTGGVMGVATAPNNVVLTTGIKQVGSVPVSVPTF